MGDQGSAARISREDEMLVHAQLPRDPVDIRGLGMRDTVEQMRVQRLGLRVYLLGIRK